jgi:AcrR family transcriptional regulator
MNGNDLRVIKTRKNIETSFIYLLSEKGFNHLTVQDILEKALINRSTFYKHYRDKYDVAEQMCARMTDGFRVCTADRFELSDEKAVESPGVGSLQEAVGRQGCPAATASAAYRNYTSV